MLRPRKGKGRLDPALEKDSVADQANDAQDEKSKAKKHSKAKTVKAESDPTSPQVWVNLIFFSFLMLILPLGVFYSIWHYTLNTTYAGIAAAVGANVVLLSFIIVAFLEKE